MWDLGNNKKVMALGQEVHYSRIIASWANANHAAFGGVVIYDEDFEEWLYSMLIPVDDIKNICEMAVCGKMELIDHANKFIESLNEVSETLVT